MESIGLHPKSGREIFAHENNYFCLVDGRHTPLANLSSEQLSEFQELKNIKAQAAASQLAQEEAARAAAIAAETEKQTEALPADVKAPETEAVDITSELGAVGTNGHSDPVGADGDMGEAGVSEDNKPYTIPEAE